MAVLDFPSGPTVGQVYTANGVSYVWDGVGWANNGTAGTGAVADGCIFESNQTINNSYTLTTNKNGLSAGPITIASGVTVTVPAGSRWVIV